MSPEMMQWARMLLDDGMPYAIVAETIGVERQTVAKHLPGYMNHREWLPVWGQILNTPRLLALHYELNDVR